MRKPLTALTPATALRTAAATGTARGAEAAVDDAPAAPGRPGM